MTGFSKFSILLSKTSIKAAYHSASIGSIFTIYFDVETHIFTKQEKYCIIIASTRYVMTVMMRDEESLRIFS